MAKQMERAELRARLQETDPYEFEHFVGELWERQGWNTTVSQGSNDMGVDVVAQKNDGVVDQKMVIQAKRYADGNKVGRPKIQQYHALKQQDPDADAAVVVTTSSFTKTAENWADSHNVKLVDGDDLATLVKQHDAEELVDRYHDPSAGSSSSSGSKNGSSKTTQSAKSAVSNSGSALSAFRAGVSRRTHQILLATVGAQAVAAVKFGYPDALLAITVDHATWLLMFGWLAMGPAMYFDARKTRGSFLKAASYGFAAWMLPVLSIFVYMYYVSKS